MIKLKDILNEQVEVSKADIKKMEKLSDKIIKDSEALLKLFRQKHKVSTRDSVLYDTSPHDDNKWEEKAEKFAKKELRKWL
jgi:hypothetical protein